MRLLAGVSIRRWSSQSNRCRFQVWPFARFARQQEAQDSACEQTDHEQTETVSNLEGTKSAHCGTGRTAAVLNTTKTAAARYQARQPKTANNEGMLAMPQIERLQAGDKLLDMARPCGRHPLADTRYKRARGIHID